MELLEIAKRVKRGVRLLDKKVPNWRRTLREHEDQYDFANGDCCVLGTLEHYNGRLRVLSAKRAKNGDYPFGRAVRAVGLKVNDDDDSCADEATQHGFDAIDGGGGSYEDEIATLDALWRAEFEK